MSTHRTDIPGGPFALRVRDALRTIQRVLGSFSKTPATAAPKNPSKCGWLLTKTYPTHSLSRKSTMQTMPTVPCACDMAQAKPPMLATSPPKISKQATQTHIDLVRYNPSRIWTCFEHLCDLQMWTRAKEIH